MLYVGIVVLVLHMVQDIYVKCNKEIMEGKKDIKNISITYHQNFLCKIKNVNYNNLEPQCPIATLRNKTS